MAQRGLADVVLGHDLWRGRRHLHLPSSDANDRIREIGKCRQREFGAVLLASTGHRRARDRGCERLESLRVDQRRQPTEPEGAGVRVCRILAALLRLHQLGNHPTLGDQLNGQCGCLTHPGDTRPDRRIASRIAQCHQPAEGARDRSGQGRDPAAAGNLHRRTLVPFDGTAVERPDSLKHILVVLAAQIVPCRPRNDPAVGSGQLKLHGADIRRARLRLDIAQVRQREQLVISCRTRQRSQLGVDSKAVLVEIGQHVGTRRALHGGASGCQRFLSAVKQPPEAAYPGILVRFEKADLGIGRVAVEVGLCQRVDLRRLQHGPIGGDGDDDSYGTRRRGAVHQLLGGPD